MKEIAGSIARNFSVMMGSQVITWASTLVLIMFLPRYLGAGGYGQLFFAMTVTQLMGLVIGLGLGALFVKDIARDNTKASTYFINGLVLRLMAWLVVFPILMIYIRFSENSQETMDVVYILAFGAALTGLTKLIHDLFQSFERMQYRSVSGIVERVFLSAVGVTLLLLGYGVKTIAIVMVAAIFLNFITSLSLIPRLFKITFNVVPSLWPSLIKRGFPFLLLQGISIIYYRIDVIMLARMTDESVVGWYGAPYRLFDSLMFFPSLLQLTVFPVFARLWKDPEGVLAQASRKVLDLTLTVGIPTAILLAALAGPIVNLLFGLENYSNSVIILQLLAISLPLVYVNFVTTTVVNAVDKQNQLAMVAGVATVLNVGLNLWLIPYFQTTSGNGAIGAAIATAITEFFVMALFLYLVPSGILNSDNLVVSMKTLAAGMVMAGAIWWVDTLVLPYYISAVVGCILYLAVLIVTRVLTKNDVDFVISLIRSRTFDATEPNSAA